MGEVVNMLSKKEIEKIFNRLFLRLCFLALKYVKDYSTAEDIVQSVFFKLLENNRIYGDTEGQINSFFFTAVKNKCINHLKSKPVRDFESYPIETIDELQKERFFQKYVVTIDTTAILYNAIDSLPNRQGEVIKLKLKNYTNQQIAEELNVSVETVKRDKNQAHQTLRKLIAHLRAE